MAKGKNLTKAEIRRLLLRPIDTRKEHTDAVGDVAGACRWFEKAIRLYGRRRVVAAMKTWARGDYFEELAVGAWLKYLGRWRAPQDKHMIPYVIASEPWSVADNMMHLLVFAPRAEQVEGPQAVAA